MRAAQAGQRFAGIALPVPGLGPRHRLVVVDLDGHERVCRAVENARESPSLRPTLQFPGLPNTVSLRLKLGARHTVAVVTVSSLHAALCVHQQGTLP